MTEVTRKRKFQHHQKYCNALKLHYLIGQNHDAKSKLQSLYKVHLNMISEGELSVPLCDSVNRGLTLVRLSKHKSFMSIILTFLPIHQMTLKTIFSLSKVRQEKKEKEFSLPL